MEKKDKKEAASEPPNCVEEVFARNTTHVLPPISSPIEKLGWKILKSQQRPHRQNPEEGIAHIMTRQQHWDEATHCLLFIDVC